MTSRNPQGHDPNRLYLRLNISKTGQDSGGSVSIEHLQKTV